MKSLAQGACLVEGNGRGPEAVGKSGQACLAVKQACSCTTTPLDLTTPAVAEDPH